MPRSAYRIQGFPALLAGLFLLSLGCGTRSAHAPGPSAPGSEASGLATLVFEGGCDASGAVALEGGRFIVGDDEDNILRVYDGRRGGKPLYSVDLSPHLELPAKKRPPEVDIEAATELGALDFWLSSHGRNSSGKEQPSRFRLFATTPPKEGTPLQFAGRPYTQLLEDLLADPRLGSLGLAEASKLAPKEQGGLNIEGMTAMPDGNSLLIGFRNPRPQGKALAIPVLNPKEIIEQGQAARFGPPTLLDLQGLGIRSLSWWRGRYLIIAGAVASEASSRLFTWRGGDDAPVPVSAADFTGLNPEAFVSPEDQEEILVLSDDGTALLDGVECKRLKDPSLKRFRGVWMRLPEDSGVTSPETRGANGP
ncbi:DUF3616 domain-containing protein [Hyalangium rubrum]|uniref:DUF3616 domain-containing protein n=1 Tax=Hyalangium rubrum TaxID=3103134 RepID=A0ABU5H8K3_9BACT|nr:DUF3616 domain-containing protein [Hyalangium sp. s54d21]MDY7229808.1 DUF3616 domain-containing protein [Hyalangium sp. s54d21]